MKSGRMRFGKFEVLARLASGGTANIFLARQVEPASLRRLVVLKTLLPNHAGDPEFRAMFVDESRLAWALSHPNCVTTYEYGAIRSTHFIAMEYIIGQPLSALLIAGARARTNIPPTVAAEVVYGAALGLHHAHELKDENGRPYNLVHRDVSPQNLMVTYEGQTKVLDFGVAKAETEREPTAFGVVKGKFGYMAPEQIDGAPVDRRSDVFSLGIVLHEALTGRRLFTAASVEEIALQILSRPIPDVRDTVPDVPAVLAEICDRALSRRPADRFPSAKAMAEALEEYLGVDARPGNEALVAEFLRQTSPDQIASTIALTESVLAGTCGTQELLRALRASPAREFDIFGLDGHLEDPVSEVRSFDTDDLEDPTHSFEDIGPVRVGDDFEGDQTGATAPVRALTMTPLPRTSSRAETGRGQAPRARARFGGSPMHAPHLVPFEVTEEISTAGQTAPMFDRSGSSASGMMLYVGPGQRIDATVLEVMGRPDTQTDDPPLVREVPPLASEPRLEGDEDDEDSASERPGRGTLSFTQRIGVEEDGEDERPAIPTTELRDLSGDGDGALTSVTHGPNVTSTGARARPRRFVLSPASFVVGLGLGLVLGVLLQRMLG